eukprot:PhM_4_TR14931/c0_g1_i1/m.10788
MSNHEDDGGEGAPTETPQHKPAVLKTMGGPSYRTRDLKEIPTVQVQPRPRLRDYFESRVKYEDWVAGDVVTEAVKEMTRADVRKLEPDSDFPVGALYFWGSFCPKCRRGYSPHIPPMWRCVDCGNHTWQPDDDPESCRCCCCQRKLDPQLKRTFMGRTFKVTNPIGNAVAHHCRRCGRLVCERCYSQQLHDVSRFGFEKPCRLCRMCVDHIQHEDDPPSDEPNDVLSDENSDDEAEATGGANDQLNADEFKLHWPPKCPQCRIQYQNPPPKWQCASCFLPVWQPDDAPEARKCAICAAPNPRVHCHRCGFHVCQTCGAYEQPLPELGWTLGRGLTVCVGCFGMRTLKPPDLWPLACPTCQKEFEKIPDRWISPCHQKPVWQPRTKGAMCTCHVCGTEAADTTSVNCHSCGRLCCVACTPYRKPMPELKFPADKGMPVCHRCFDEFVGYEPTHVDQPTWLPSCARCKLEFPTPPPRWQCPHCTSMTWQPKDDVWSQICWVCKKTPAKSTNCRRCGRVVCDNPCGKERHSVVERSFVAGTTYPVCSRCFTELKAQDDAVAASEDEKKKTENEHSSGAHHHHQHHH